jgi:tetratricopeptide (TPR) repeat protein
MLFAAGRLQEAEAQYLEALALNPAMEAQINTDLAFLLILQQRFGEALALISEYAAGEARDQGLALAYHGLGRESEANSAFDRLVATPGADAAFRTAEVHAFRGDVAESFKWLATAHTRVGTPEVHPRHFPLLIQMCWSPFLAPLHSDARWEQWLADVRALKRIPVRSSATSGLQARMRQVLKLENDSD